MWCWSRLLVAAVPAGAAGGSVDPPGLWMRLVPGAAVFLASQGSPLRRWLRPRCPPRRRRAGTSQRPGGAPDRAGRRGVPGGHEDCQRRVPALARSGRVGTPRRRRAGPASPSGAESAGHHAGRGRDGRGIVARAAGAVGVRGGRGAGRARVRSGAARARRDDRARRRRRHRGGRRGRLRRRGHAGASATRGHLLRRRSRRRVWAPDARGHGRGTRGRHRRVGRYFGRCGRGTGHRHRDRHGDRRRRRPRGVGRAAGGRFSDPGCAARPGPRSGARFAGGARGGRGTRRDRRAAGRRAALVVP